MELPHSTPKNILLSPRASFMGEKYYKIDENDKIKINDRPLNENKNKSKSIVEKISNSFIILLQQQEKIVDYPETFKFLTILSITIFILFYFFFLF